MSPWTVALQAPLSVEFSRQEYWSGYCHALLQGIFPTQGSNLGLLHCRQTLYRLSPREAQDIMKDPNDQLEKGVSISRSGNVPSAGASFCPQAFGALPSQQVDMDTSPETH